MKNFCNHIRNLVLEGNIQRAVDMIHDLDNLALLDEIHTPIMKSILIYMRNQNGMNVGKYIDYLEPNLQYEEFIQNVPNNDRDGVCLYEKNPLIKGSINYRTDNEKIPALEKFWYQRKDINNSVHSYEYDNVLLIGYDFGFAVFSENENKFIFSNPYTNHRAFQKISRQQEVEIPNLVFFGDRFKPNNYCHFLVDHLPRICTFETLGYKGIYGSFHLALNDFQRKYFEICRVRDRIFSLDKNTTYRVKKLNILNTSMRSFKHMFNRQNILYMQNMLKFFPKCIRNGTKDIKRIFITRNQHYGRTITNNLEFLQLVQKYGFIAIDTDSLNIDEQMKIFSFADYIIAIHGAALTNILYAKPGSSVLELFPTNYGTAAFCLLADMRQLKYRGLVGEPLNKTWEFSTSQQPIYIDIEKAESKIIKMLEG